MPHRRHLGSTPGDWPAQEAQGSRREGVGKKEELRQARESRDLTKQQVEVCETEAEKSHSARSWRDTTKTSKGSKQQ